MMIIKRRFYPFLKPAAQDAETRWLILYNDTKSKNAVYHYDSGWQISPINLSSSWGCRISILVKNLIFKSKSSFYIFLPAFGLLIALSTTVFLVEYSIKLSSKIKNRKKLRAETEKKEETIQSWFLDIWTKNK